MKLQIATPEDAKLLAEFYRQFPMRGLVDLKLDRFDDYFAPYAIQSDQSLTYILKDEEKIEGTASFVIQDCLLDGKTRPVAFGRDLRISSNRHAVLEWSKHFLPVMEEVQHHFGCRYLFSILSRYEIQALNAFVRPRHTRRSLPRYYLYRRFNLVSVHGKLPWAKNPLPHIRVRAATDGHLDALIYYISQRSNSRDLSTVWDSQSFFAKLLRWKGLKLESFLIALDAQDNIIGCVAPWSSVGIQEYIPLEYSLRAHNFRQFLKFGQTLGWTRALTKPVSRLKIEASFDFRYLNFLHADNEDIFECLLWHCYEKANPNEFLVYAQTRAETVYRRPINWITAGIPYGVYLIQDPLQEPPKFLHPSNERPVEIEPFFL